MAKCLLEIDSNGYALTRLKDDTEVTLPTVEEEVADPNLGLLCSGRSFGMLVDVLEELTRK